jgi:glutathione S-transferase
VSDTLPELLHFHYSHFNEKVRWALDWKGIPHRRRALLPGPHAFTALRLTGQTEVPILRTEEGALYGSAAIIEALEARTPEPRLVPEDPEQREEALALQARFDEHYGPLVRRALFARLLDEGEFVCGFFGEGRGALSLSIYRALFPITRTFMKKGMGIGDTRSIGDALAATLEAFDLVAERSARTGYLVGDSFSVADLAAAALLAPAAGPTDSPMELPGRYPAVMNEWLGRWHSHPGRRWVEEMYRQHRLASAEAPG